MEVNSSTGHWGSIQEAYPCHNAKTKAIELQNLEWVWPRNTIESFTRIQRCNDTGRGGIHVDIAGSGTAYDYSS